MNALCQYGTTFAQLLWYMLFMYPPAYLPLPHAVLAPLFFLILISKTDLKHQMTNQKQFARNPQPCKKLTKNRRWYSGINSDTPVTGASIALCSVRCTNGHRTRFCRAKFYSCRTVCTSEYFFKFSSVCFHRN